MDLVNRLKYFMDYYKLTISQFADTCNIPRPTMSQLMNGRNKRISDEIINKIHNGFPSLSILWLMFGEGDMDVRSNMQLSEPQNPPISNNSHPQNIDSQDDITNLPSNFNPSPENPENPIMEDSLFETSNFEKNHHIFTESISNSNLASDFSKANISFDTSTDEASSRVVTDTAKSRETTSPEIQYSVKVEESARRNNANDITRTLGRPERAQEQSYASASDGCISISPDSHKKITNIVVFYSDNSFQSFLPDS